MLIFHAYTNIKVYIYIYIYIYIMKLKEKIQFCCFIINLFRVYKMTLIRCIERRNTVVYLNMIKEGLYSSGEKIIFFNLIFSIFWLKKKKKPSSTVEISSHFFSSDYIYTERKHTHTHIYTLVKINSIYNVNIYIYIYIYIK